MFFIKINNLMKKIADYIINKILKKKTDNKKKEKSSTDDIYPMW